MSHNFHEAYRYALESAESLRDGFGVVGFGVVTVSAPDGSLKQAIPFANKITSAGDQYYAQKAIVGIAPASAAAPTAVSGMKLGTSSATAPAKSGAGAALGAYLAGSQAAFDATYPQVTSAGTDLGYNVTYKTTWAAGVPAGTNSIVEAVIVNDAATNATSTAANTIARVTFTAVSKTSADSLAITWSHTFLGA